ncbi:MAG: DNA polymerase III subunit delta [Prevotella sp.]|nr:DNA polymerase III subunit delta [Prevotella sp.]
MFEQVIGQQEVQERLMQLVREGRLPHALMLCGPAGCGKMALAIGFAKVLLSSSTQHPSPVTQQAMLDKLEHPDLHFTYPTIKLPSMGSDHKPVSDDFIHEWQDFIKAGPYFTMTQWMEQMGGENQQAIITAGESDALIRKLSLKSSQGGYKVSIIWLPERMNIECANKILKLLEEPPAQTVFIMVCQEPEKLLETIQSRVQRIDVKRIDSESIRQALIERRGISPDMAERLSRMANGSWLKALELLSADSENELFLDMFQTLMRLAYQRKVKDLKAWTERMATMGRERQRRFLEYFLRLIRENFMYNFRQADLCYMSQREEDFARNFARFVNEANILPVTDLANRAYRDIGQNANAKIVFFDFALQMIVLLIQK